MNRETCCRELAKGLPRVCALIGGGGKTTLLYALGDFLAREGKSVLLTTTTHLAWDENAVSPASAAQLNEMLRPGGVTVAGFAGENGRMTGISPQWYEALNADTILVEADGSRGLPLKVHRPHEPAIPPQTELVIQMAGLSALGQAAEVCVHGWAEAGLNPHAPADAPLMGALLRRGLDKWPGKSVILLNQADTPLLEAQGQRVAALLPEFQVLVAKLKEEETC